MLSDSTVTSLHDIGSRDVAISATDRRYSVRCGMNRLAILALAIMASWGIASAQAGDKKYGPGVTDREIKLGQTVPYSGPVSPAAALGRGAIAYFEKVNREKGGVNGRKIRLISLDDAYSPPKAVEQTRKLVESEDAVAIFGSMGTAQNSAVQKYLTSKKVPQLFVFAASDRFADPKTSPYTISGMTLFSTEAAIYARLVAEHTPGSRVAVLYQNDDYGREYLRSFKAELARLDPKAEIVAASPYEVTSPT